MAAEKNRASKGSAGVWYAKGLRFTCRQCGRCCSGPPGYVWVTGEERMRMAAFLGLEPKELERRYCRRVWWRISLQELSNGDCIFLTPQGCRVYPVRPLQCFTFPFWPDNIASAARWQRQKGLCPGVGSGRLYSRREIERVSAGEDST